MTPEQIKNARAALKTSQAKIAKALKISTRQYIRYETGASVAPGPVCLILKGWVGRRWPKRPVLIDGHLTGRQKI